jgi:hypothetical protein
VNATAKQQLSRNPQNAGYSNPIKTYPVPAITNEDGTISVPAQPVYGIDPNHEPIDMYLATRTIPGGTPQLLAQGTGQATGALGLLAAVTNGFRWQVDYILCDFTASATVGNRLLYGQITDGTSGAVVWTGLLSAAVVAAATANYDVNMGGGTVGTGVRRNIPGTANTTIGVREVAGKMVLNGSSRFIIKDSANIDNADTCSYAIYGTVLPV